MNQWAQWIWRDAQCTLWSVLRTLWDTMAQPRSVGWLCWIPCLGSRSRRLEEESQMFSYHKVRGKRVDDSSILVWYRRHKSTKKIKNLKLYCFWMFQFTIPWGELVVHRHLSRQRLFSARARVNGSQSLIRCLFLLWRFKLWTLFQAQFLTCKTVNKSVPENHTSTSTFSRNLAPCIDVGLAMSGLLSLSYGWCAVLPRCWF